MILTCPSCGTQYAVKEGAIPPQGRQVRCASCKHSWHQDPEEAPADEASADETGLADTVEAPPEPFEDSGADQEVGTEPVDEEAHKPEESLAEAALIEPREGPAAEERAFEEASIAAGELIAPPSDFEGNMTYQEPEIAIPEPIEAEERVTPDALGADDDFSPFARRDEVEPEPRRRAWPLLLLILLLIAIAAAFWFLAPAPWKERLGLAGIGETPLQLMMTHSDRQKLASGNELLAVSGRVINPTEKDQKVPPIEAELRSRDGKLVYSWTIAPPARTLPPGASATFNSAEINVPAGGDELTITLGAPRA